MGSSKKNILFAVCCLLIANLFGCATIKEGAKGIAGLSTRALEDGRRDAVKKTFNYDHNSCYNKVGYTLKRMGSYVYAQDAEKRMVAVYVSTSDTTPVGIFFKEIDANNTEVEVSSPSTYAKEFIAARIFKDLGPQEKPAASEAQK